MGRRFLQLVVWGESEHELTMQVTGLGSSNEQAMFQLEQLRRMCSAVAPTEATKKSRLFIRRTPIAASAGADSFITLGEAVAVLALHLSRERPFPDLAAQVSSAASVAVARATSPGWTGCKC